ncbi:MAG TPA: triose-phosphate isomerase, partial [Thermomicrobiales bacterium]|nr:triose-phosphate isomerase [Thermomicrobiales bacterium]
AQDVSPHDAGAYTGEVSAAMIATWGDFALVGHSERRQFHGETNTLVAGKVQALMRSGLTAVVCVGESLVQREAGDAAAIVTSQLSTAIDGLGPDHASRLVVAYEPVWAIGTGVSAQPADAAAMAGTIRNVLTVFGSAADAIRILYGGSVNAANSGTYLQQPGIDGALVGGASLQPDTFAAIVKSALPGRS